MADAVDVRERTALLGLDAQLLKFTVEQYDVPDHEITGIRTDQRRQATGFFQIVRDRFFQQDSLAGFQQYPDDGDVLGRRAGDDPGFGVRFCKSLLQTRPARHAWKLGSESFQAGLSPRY